MSTKIIQKAVSKIATADAQPFSLSFDIDTMPGEELTVLVYSTSGGGGDKYNMSCNFVGASYTPSTTSHQPYTNLIGVVKYTLIATGNALKITVAIGAYTSRGTIIVMVIRGKSEFV